MKSIMKRTFIGLFSLSIIGFGNVLYAQDADPAYEEGFYVGGNPTDATCSGCEEAEIRFSNATVSGESFSFDVDMKPEATVGLASFGVRVQLNTDAINRAECAVSNARPPAAGSDITAVADTIADDRFNVILSRLPQVLGFGPSTSLSDFIVVNANVWNRMFTMTCPITDNTMPAEIAFHSGLWKEAARINLTPTLGAGETRSITIALRATNALLDAPLFEVPFMVGYTLDEWVGEPSATSPTVTVYDTLKYTVNFSGSIVSGPDEIMYDLEAVRRDGSVIAAGTTRGGGAAAASTATATATTETAVAQGSPSVVVLLDSIMGTGTTASATILTDAGTATGVIIRESIPVTSGTAAGDSGPITGVVLPDDVTEALTVTEVEANGTYTVELNKGVIINFDSEENADNPIDYYRIAMYTGSSVVLNATAISDDMYAYTLPDEDRIPVQDEWAATFSDVTAIPISRLGDDRFHVIVNFGAPVSAIDTAAGEIAMSVMSNGGTITGASVVPGSLRLGFPTGVNLNTNPTELMAVEAEANVVSFMVDPTGTLDQGESALGNEVFTATLPSGLITVEGTSEFDPLEFEAIENGAPEIRAFMVSTQSKVYTIGANDARTLGDIIYTATFTEPVGAIAGQLRAALTTTAKLHPLSEDRIIAGIAGLTAGASVTDGTIAFGEALNQRPTVSVSGNEATLTFSNVEISSDVNSLVAVIEAGSPVFGLVEDCESLTGWYTAPDGSPRRNARTDACVAQEAADAPTGDVVSAEPAPVEGAGTGAPTDPHRVSRVAGLYVGTLAERMEHFRWTVSAGVATVEPQNANGDPFPLRDQMRSVPFQVQWRIADARGFSLRGMEATALQYYQFLEEVEFRDRLTVVPDGETAATVIVERTTRTDAVAVPVALVDPVSDDASFAAGFAPGANQGPVEIPFADATQLIYRISTSSTVWRMGEPLTSLATAVYAAGIVDQARAARLNAGQTPPAVVTGVSQGFLQVQAGNTVTVTYENGMSGPGAPCDLLALPGATDACSSLHEMTISTSTEVTVMAMLTGRNVELTIDASAHAIGDIVSLGLDLRHAGSTEFVLPLNLVVVNDADAEILGGADANGNGIPDAQDMASAYILPLSSMALYAAPTDRYSLSARVGYRTLSRLASRVEGADMLEARNFRMGDLPGVFGSNDADIIALHFANYNVMSDVVDGNYVAGRVGLVFSLNGVSALTDVPVRFEKYSGRTFEPVEGSDAEYGTFNSQGTVVGTDDCPEDNGYASSPYRDAEGNLMTGRGDCMVVYITDGGQYDEDGQRNGVVVDPGRAAIGAAPEAPQPTVTTGGGGGGGGAIALNEVIGLLALLGLVAYGIRRQRRYE